MTAQQLTLKQVNAMINGGNIEAPNQSALQKVRALILKIHGQGGFQIEDTTPDARIKALQEETDRAANTKSRNERDIARQMNQNIQLVKFTYYDTASFRGERLCGLEVTFRRRR